MMQIDILQIPKRLIRDLHPVRRLALKSIWKKKKKKTKKKRNSQPKQMPL